MIDLSDVFFLKRFWIKIFSKCWPHSYYSVYEWKGQLYYEFYHYDGSCGGGNGMGPIV